jgi:hypothetical protein
MPPIHRVRPSLILVTVLSAFGGGCGGPVLEGKVVLGSMSGAELVAEGDPALKQPGLAGASIVVIRDPGRPNAETVARSASRADGTFRIPVEAFGAGWMSEEWQVIASKPGDATSEYRGPLPLPGDRMLFMLVPGTFDPSAGVRSRDRLMQDIDAYRR